jgi:hypothetical protein
MELILFHDRIYGKLYKKLYTFETTWDSFRPISGIGWNGKQLVPIDAEYKKDLFSQVYGYGSQEEKNKCQTLTQETELSEYSEMKDPISLWRWYGETNVKWWRDRPCVFRDPCVSRDANSWKHYLKYLDSRAKTLRRPFHGRATKRLLPK